MRIKFAVIAVLVFTVIAMAIKSGDKEITGIQSAEVKAGKGQEKDLQKAYFAGGCFWGVDYRFRQQAGVVSVTSGYMGGKTENPTYKEVCTGKTGHAETVEVVYDPNKTTYENLAKVFFEIHDPTQFNRQGPDIGYQYRSAIFYVDSEQKQIAKQLIEQLRKKGLDVVTSVEPAEKFWPAENYHQNYYGIKAGQPYCHIRVKRF